MRVFCSYIHSIRTLQWKCNALTLSQIHLLLITMRLTEIMIAEGGELKGVVTRDQLKLVLYQTAWK